MFKGAEFRKFLSPQPRQSEKIFATLANSASKKALSKNQDDDNIDALCVNCQEMININIIDQHSQVCFKVTEKSFQIDDKLNNEQIDFKLARLKKALESQLSSQKMGSSEKNLRLQLIDCIQKVLRFNEKSDLKQIRTLKDLLGGIQELSNNFNGYPSLLLYLERVKALGQEKYRDLIKSDQETVCNWKDQLSGQKNMLTKASSKKVLHTSNNENVPRSSYGFKGITNPLSEKLEYNLQPKTWNVPVHPAFAGTHRNPQRDSDMFNKNAKMQKNQSSANISLSTKSDLYFNGAQTNENLARNQSPTLVTRVERSSITSPVKDYINCHPFFKQKENNDVRGSLPMNLASNIRIRMENSQSGNNIIDEELRMSLPVQSLFRKNDSVMSPLISRDRNIINESNENLIYSKSEQKVQSRFQSPERGWQRDSVMSSSSLSNAIPLEHCSPSQRYRNCDNSEQRSVSRDSIKFDLEQKLEQKKKELAKVTSLVKKYKHRTATIQISLNDSNSSNKEERLSRGRTSLKIGQSQSATKPSSRGGEFENLETGGSQNWLYKTQDNNESFEEKLSVNSLRYNEETSLDEYNQSATLEEADTEESIEQRFFYSKCLAFKMKFKNNPHSQHIPVGLVYKDAVKNNVPQSQWDRFIDNAFMHPERYIDLNKLQKKKKQGQGLQNRLIEIAHNKAIMNKNSSLTQLHVISN